MLATMVASSAAVGSAMADVTDPVRDGGACTVGFSGRVVEVDEDRLDDDTRLSRAFRPKTGGPRLRSS
jgi:ribonuclease PH